MLRICGLRSQGSLWITHLTVLWITHLTVLWITGFALWITGLSALWITHLTVLWISQPFVLGRIYPLAGLAVDYDAAHLWISGMWGLASPPPPSGRTEP